jgi:hypothetical protein
MNHRLTSIVMAIAGLVILSNCAGPRYSKVKDSPALKPNETQGMVLVYWDKSFFTKDAGKFNLYASKETEGNGPLLTSRIHRGSFYSLPANPGYLRLTSRPGHGPGRILSSLVNTVLSPFESVNIATIWKRDSLVVSVQPAETYFVSLRWLRMKSRPELRLMTPEEGRNEMRNCRWLNQRD